MNKILKIFLALVLAVSMMLEMVPVNIISADDEVPVVETTEPVETAQENADETEEEPEVLEIAEETFSAETEEPIELDAPVENLEETDDPAEEVFLNAEAFSQEYVLDDLKVTVAYEAGTVPEGTEVVVSEAKEEAIEAIRAESEEDINVKGADISFIYNDEEIEPKDYSDKKVTVTLEYVGEENLTGRDFETVHVKETLDEADNVVYGVETVEAVMIPVTDRAEVPYEYIWVETIANYKEIPVYGDVEVEYEEEVPVYETREITEEHTELVTKTREVEKTRLVKVKVDFVWWDPTTWLGYKYVWETYTVTETYEEEETVTVVVGYEEVQVGTTTETRTRIEQGIIGTETVEYGTQEIVHTETKYEEQEIVVGQVAVFESNDFSTFTVTWSNGSSVTVHHGYMEGNTFREFASSSNSNYPTSLSTNNYSGNNVYAYLVYDFAGYTYSAAYYVNNSNGATNPTQYTRIAPVLNDYNNYNQWRYTTNTSGGNNINFNYTLSNNNHIYVIYTKLEPTQGANGSSGSGSGGSGQNDFVPDVGKNVSTQKADGTYDISLGFVGDKEPATYAKARVIVVFDLSGSMNDAVSSSDSTIRLTAAKNAVNRMAQELLALKDNNNQQLVEMGLVTFSTDAEIRSFGGTNPQFTSNYSTYSNVVNGLSASGGTNWEKALNLANGMAAATDSKTYIVFISDGDPTYRVSRGNYTDTQLYNEHYASYNDGNRDWRTYRTVQGLFGMGTTENNNVEFTTSVSRCYNAAAEVAKSITSHNKGLFTVGLSSDGAARLQSMATYAGNGAEYKDGSNAETFAASMAEIAGKISDEVGLSDMTITDGVTSMSQIETQSLVGTAGDFEYFKSYPLTQNGNNYTYTIGTTTYTVTQAQVTAGSDGNGHRIFSRDNSSGATVLYIEYPWNIDDNAKATVNSNNAVVWDTTAVNNELEHGVYYSVKFTVWPKQEAYDLIADLENGIVKVTDTDLAAGTKAQLRILIGGTTYEYDTASGKWNGTLTDEGLQALIDENDATFSMKTNTGLSANYKYGGVEMPTANYVNYANGDMSLDATTIKIKKTWNNYLDARDASDVTLTVVRKYVENGVEKTEEYTTIQMGEPDEVETAEGGKQWVQTPDQDIYISLGVLSVTGEDITVREKGYDYSVEEPANFSYRWDLTSDIYHPMVINGVTTVLIEVTDTTDLPTSVTGLGENKTVTVDGKTYYKFGGELYVAKSGENLLEATNDRRSNLIISKAVEDETAPEDDLFPIQITIDNPNSNHPSDTDYNFWYDAPWFYVSTASDDRSTIVMEDIVVSDNVSPEISELRTDNSDITNIVTHVADSNYPYDYITYNYKGSPNTVKAVDLQLHTGTETKEVEGQQVTVEYQYYSYYTGFYWFDNGATATISIKDGWYINFNNMGRDTTYTIVEPTADMPDGYVLDEVTSRATNTQNEAVTPATVNGNTATGTIDRANSYYYVDYKNTYLGVFYVYHSSNNTVERLPMAVDGVAYSASNTFSIFDKTAAGTLYGGYYHAYAGSTIAEDKGATLEYTDNLATDSGEGAKAYTCQYIKDSNKAAWDADDAYTVSGDAMVPERDVTYFLKEVPENYLMPYTHYTYYKESKKLSGLLAVLGIDDLNYNDAGFVIIEVQNPVDNVVSKLRIKANNGSVTTTLTAASVYKAKGVLDGYLGYADITKKIGTDLIIKQYWETLDGIEVQGTTKRTLTFGDGTYNGLQKTDSPNN